MSCCCQAKVSCGCCTERRRFNCGSCGWAPNKCDYPLSNPAYGGHVRRDAVVAVSHANRAYNRYNNRGAYGRNGLGFGDVDRFADFYGYGYWDYLRGRVNAGGFDQPDQQNWDGDE